MLELDNVDIKILKMLLDDGRETLSEIAKEVGLSTSGVRRRIKRLEDKDILEGYTAKIDPDKIGYGVAAFLNVDVKSSEVGRVAGILSRCKGVCEVHKTTGDHGLIAKVRAEDRATISEFVEDRVSTYQGVKDVEITMTMETYKEELLDI
ncbi:MAG: Lrp/AsnC family transcriptional regulator [Candidatus Hadarchaeota archaeon]